MLFDDAGRVLASDDNYREAALAMEDALNELERRERAVQRSAMRG